MDILDYLEADQDALRSLIVEFKIAEEESAHEAEAFTVLVSAFKAQTEALEALFKVLPQDSELMQNAVNSTLERFKGAREVEQMIECCTNRATWRASVNIYSEMLENGFEAEQKELFPVLFEQMGFEERRKLGREYRKLRGFKTHRLLPDTDSKTDWQNLWSFVINQAG